MSKIWSEMSSTPTFYIPSLKLCGLLERALCECPWLETEQRPAPLCEVSKNKEFLYLFQDSFSLFSRKWMGIENFFMSSMNDSKRFAIYMNIFDLWELIEVAKIISHRDAEAQRRI